MTAAAGLSRHPDFRRLWAAQIGSAFGSRITRTALPIIAILSVHATPGEVAVLSALGVAPGVIVGLLAGGRIDRSAKLPILVGADLVRAALILTVPAAAVLGALTMPQLYAVAAAVGAATALFQLADNTLLPTLVGRELVVAGNARLEATDAVAETAGPGMAGLLIELVTAPVAMIADALSYLWSALMLSRIRTVESPPAAAGSGGASVADDIAAGVRACLAHPTVARSLAADAIAHFFGGFFLALYMVLALRTLALSPAVVGLVISVGGVGALGGALLAAPLARRIGTGPAMLAGLAGGQAANLLIPLTLHARGFAVPLLVAQQVVGDALLGAYLVHAVSLRQRALPNEVLGRANATVHVVNGIALPLGALAAGPAVWALGLGGALWFAALGGLLAVPVLVSSSVVRLR